MVHSHDTSVTLGAVMRSWWFDCLTGGAALPEFLSDQLHLIDFESAHLPYLNVLLAFWLWVSYQAFRLNQRRILRRFATFFSYLLGLFLNWFLLLGQLANKDTSDFIRCFNSAHVKFHWWKAATNVSSFMTFLAKSKCCICGYYFGHLRGKCASRGLHIGCLGKQAICSWLS